MKIFIIVGMPASGKNLARVYAESKHIPYFATGDLVRAEVKKRGLDPTPENTGRVSTELRGKDGLGVTRLALAGALQSGQACGFPGRNALVARDRIDPPKSGGDSGGLYRSERGSSERVAARGRSDDSPAQFDERDSREIQYGAAVPIALADEYILNTGSMEEAAAAFGSNRKEIQVGSGS